jgi:uncharacterized membrane protein YdjX (TVP38/TMEM64 family)
MSFALPTLKLFLLSAYTVIGPLIGIIFIALYLEDLKTLSDSNLLVSLVMLLIGAVLVAIALLPSIILALLVGFIGEGYLISYLLAALAIFFATFIGLLISKTLSNGLLEEVLSFKKRWQDTYKQLIAQSGSKLYWMIFLLRLSPHMPFAFTNLIVAQSGVSLTYGTLFSWLGLLPRTILATIIGAGLSNITEVLSSRPLSVWEWSISIIALIGVFLSIALSLRTVGGSHRLKPR